MLFDLIRLDLDVVPLLPDVVPVALFVKFVLIPLLLQENIPPEEVFVNLRCSRDGLSVDQRLQIFGSNKFREEDTKFLVSWRPLPSRSPTDVLVRPFRHLYILLVEIC